GFGERRAAVGFAARVDVGPGRTGAWSRRGFCADAVDVHVALRRGADRSIDLADCRAGARRSRRAGLFCTGAAGHVDLSADGLAQRIIESRMCLSSHRDGNGSVVLAVHDLLLATDEKMIK